MCLVILKSLPKSSLKALLAHLGEIDDPREPWRVAYRLSEVLLLVVCATICDCDDYDAIAAWGKTHLVLLRRHLPFDHGVPGGRWLTLLMNRIDPAGSPRCSRTGASHLARSARTGGHRRQDLATQPPPGGRHAAAAPGLGFRHHGAPRALPGGRPRQGERNHRHPGAERPSRRAGRAQGGSRLDRHHRHHPGHRDHDSHYLLAVKANQPTLRAEIEALFADRKAGALDTHHDVNKGQGRFEQRRVTVAREVDWLDGGRRFPGETRLPGVACVRVSSRTELKDRCRFDTRFYVSSASLTAPRAAEAVRGHWGIENRLHWVLDVVFADDRSRLRKGHGAHTMAIVRHFAVNLLRM